MVDEIVSWIREQVHKASAKGIVVGLSGGLDSSVVAVLSKMAFLETTLGLMLPCGSPSLDEEHARLVARKFEIPIRTVELTSVFEELLGRLAEEAGVPAKDDIPVANLKPRLRMIALYYFANRLNYLVAGTGNKSELMAGYLTKFGDGGVDILPLGGLLKSQVRELAKKLDIPEEIISKVPSAGLWEGQTDEGEMGITYEDLDRVLLGMERGDLTGLNESIVRVVKEKMAASEHKRRPPEIFEPGQILEK